MCELLSLISCCFPGPFSCFALTAAVPRRVAPAYDTNAISFISDSRVSIFCVSCPGSDCYIQRYHAIPTTSCPVIDRAVHHVLR